MLHEKRVSPKSRGLLPSSWKGGVERTRWKALKAPHRVEISPKSIQVFFAEEHHEARIQDLLLEFTGNTLTNYFDPLKNTSISNSDLITDHARTKIRNAGLPVAKETEALQKLDEISINSVTAYNNSILSTELKLIELNHKALIEKICVNYIDEAIDASF